MPHERIGHLRVPIRPTVRRNPPTTGGMSVPDDRFAQMVHFIENYRKEAQMDALSQGKSADERAQALGRYHAVLAMRDRYLSLYETAMQNAGDIQGETSDRS